jgi:hypothetical protein
MYTLKKRLLIWAIAITALLMISLVAMKFIHEVQWSFGDFVIMGAILFGIELAHELIARKSEKTKYSVSFGIGLAGVFILLWVNGAVGIIGSEDNPANLMYGVVLIAGIIGSFLSRFKSRGMARTLFVMAAIQLLVPVVALTIWPANASWGSAGVLGVFVFNAIFVLVFIVSALLFRQASEP